jgi:hypothetical protein
VRKLLVLAVSLLVLAALIAPVFATGQFDNIITTADVEKATGLTGVKQVPREPLDKLRNGDLNFVANGNQPILMIQFRPLFLFETVKADSGYFKTSIPGVGDAAFTSPAFEPQFSVNFIKGNHYAIVTTNIDPKDKTRTILKLDQLITLSKIVASRM